MLFGITSTYLNLSCKYACSVFNTAAHPAVASGSIGFNAIQRRVSFDRDFACSRYLHHIAEDAVAPPCMCCVQLSYSCPCSSRGVWMLSSVAQIYCSSKPLLCSSSICSCGCDRPPRNHDMLYHSLIGHQQHTSPEIFSVKVLCCIVVAVFAGISARQGQPSSIHSTTWLPKCQPVVC